MQPDVMTKSERNELMKLARMRANVAKKDIEARGADQMAEIERQLAARYSAQHKAWEHITEEADAMVQKYDAQIAKLCEQMGVPASLRPELHLSWYDRGESRYKERRLELRKVAVTTIDANIQKAKIEVDRATAHICSQLVAEGLTTKKANEFFKSFPTPEKLMPQLSLPDIEMTKATLDEQDRFLTE